MKSNVETGCPIVSSFFSPNIGSTIQCVSTTNRFELTWIVSI